MRRTAVLVTTLLLAACSGGTATPASTTPVPTMPATISPTIPSSPTPHPGAVGTCSVDGVVSGGLALTLPSTMPAHMGWRAAPDAWGVKVERRTPIDVLLADGSTLPMNLELTVMDEDGLGPEEPTLTMILAGRNVYWPSPPTNATPQPGAQSRPDVFVTLYWTRSPLPTESFPPGEGTVVFNGRFSATFDVTFPHVELQTVYAPAGSVIGPGDIRARGSVACEFGGSLQD